MPNARVLCVKGSGMGEKAPIPDVGFGFLGFFVGLPPVVREGVFEFFEEFWGAVGVVCSLDDGKGLPFVGLVSEGFDNLTGVRLLAIVCVCREIADE
jgi:hypothetical protein